MFEIASAERFTKQESQSLLMSMKSLSGLGRNLTQTLEMIIDSEDDAKVKKLLKRALNDILDNHTDPATSLANVGLLHGVEPFVLRRSKTTRIALENILDLRESDGKYEITLLKIFVIPFIMSIVAFIVPIFVREPLQEFTDMAVELVMTVKNINILSQMSPPFWYEDISSVYIILIALITSGVLIVWWYAYNFKNNPKALYKSPFFKNKVYDDALIYFKLIASLRGGGLSGQEIIKILYDEESRRAGWKKIFRELHHEISSSGGKKAGGISKIFEDNGFPKDIVINIKSAERGGNLWMIFGELSKYASEKSDQNATLMTVKYKFLAMMVGYLVFLYMVGSVFMFGLGTLLTMQTTMI